jgi:hypothetical protein
MFPELTLVQWFSFTVVAAVVSTFGSLLGILIKEYFLSRSFETWKQRRSLEQLYEKYRDPLLLAGRELCSRLDEVLEEYPTVYLRSPVLTIDPTGQRKNTIHDPYFQKYKLVSTIYRLCAFLGWLELYRQETVFLDSGRAQHTRNLEQCIQAIRGDLADGHINTAEDWNEWRDCLIFREELRAIGESMLDVREKVRAVVGYARFCDLFGSDGNESWKRWIGTVTSLLLDLEIHRRDFRRVRMQRLAVHLVDLLILLDDKGPAQRFLNLRARYASAV